MQTVRFPHEPIPVRRTILDNGFTVITAERPSTRVLAKLVLPFGSLDDGALPGTAHFLEHLLCEDPALGGVHPLFRRLVAHGAMHSAATDYRSTTYWFSGAPEELPEAIRALAVLAFDHTCTDAAVAAERPIILREYEEHVWDDQCPIWRMRTLFPECLPAHHGISGTHEGITAITAADLAAAHARWYRPSVAALVIVGGITHDAAVDVVTRSDLLTVPGTPEPRRKFLVPNCARTEYVDRNLTEELACTFAFPVDPIAAFHLRFALDVLCTAPFGILHEKLRTEERLVYGIDTAVLEWPFSEGEIVIPSAAEQFPSITSGIRNGIAALTSGAYAPDAWRSERDRRLRGLAARTEHNHVQWAEELVGQWLAGESQRIDWIAETAAITPDALAAVAVEHLAPERMGCLTVVHEPTK